MSDIAPPIESLHNRLRTLWAGWRNSIGVKLAWRNIARDRIRLVVAVVGVGFAVLLMTVQLGLLIGFAVTASSLVDNAKADIWIVPRGAKDVDQAGVMPEKQKYAALGVPGVEAAQSLVVRFTEWKRPDGGTESVIVVGIDSAQPMLEPWSFVTGSTESLRFSNGVVIDELYAQKLGITQLGQTVEILNRRARVVGITSKVRTFTQSPYVFTSLTNAKTLTSLADDRTSYVLVKARPGTDIDELAVSLQAAIPAADVWTSRAFSWQTEIYWLFTTGAGTAVLVAAVLGLIVGLVIVSQTLYAATVENIEQYATMRAIGASNRYLQSIILLQSLLSGSLGYVAGTAAALTVAWFARRASATMLLSPGLILTLAVVTLAMCIGASLISIRKVLHVDAASVFR